MELQVIGIVSTAVRDVVVSMDEADEQALLAQGSTGRQVSLPAGSPMLRKLKLKMRPV